MVSCSEQALVKFKSRFEKPLQELPINMISQSIAIANDDKYPVQFEFVTDTYVDFKT